MMRRALKRILAILLAAGVCALTPAMSEEVCAPAVDEAAEALEFDLGAPDAEAPVGEPFDDVPVDGWNGDGLPEAPDAFNEASEAVEAAAEPACAHARVRVEVEGAQSAYVDEGDAETHRCAGGVVARRYCLDCGAELSDAVSAAPGQSAQGLSDAHRFEGDRCALCGYAAQLAGDAQVRLGVGEKLALNVRYASAGATGRLRFESSKASVASVNAKTGLVTAKKQGTAVVTVTAANGNQLSVEVQVLKKPRSIVLSEKEALLGVGEAMQLSYVLPEGSWGAVTYSSSDARVATVDAEGRVLAVGTGKARITAKLYNGKKAVCKLTVAKAPTQGALKLSLKRESIGVGEAMKAAALFDGCGGGVQFSSSGRAAEVDAMSGVVLGRAPGRVTLTVTAYNGVKATAELTVLPAPESVTLADVPAQLGVGEEWRLGALVNAGAAAAVTFTSSQPKVLAVDPVTGALKPKKTGRAVVTASTYNGKQASATIVVAKRSTSIKLNVTKATMGVGQTGTLTAKLSSGSSGQVAFSTSDPAVATVDGDGVVTAVGPGKATITARVYSGKKATCAITVTPQADHIAFRYERCLMVKGENVTNAAVLSSGGKTCPGKVSYVSSDTKVAKVSAEGVISAVGSGEAVITATTYNGICAQCAVFVAAPGKLTSVAAKAIKPQVEVLDWYKDGDGVLKKGGYGYLYDIDTGILMRIKRMGGSRHADVEPATRDDTARLKKIAGGRFSWDSHAVILIVDGRFVACAINTMPHGDQTITNNGYDGQFCLHMVGSRTHGTNNVNAQHQKAIQRAWEWAQK